VENAERVGSIATASTAATPAAVSATAATATTAATTIFPWASFIDRQRTATVLLAIEPLDGRLRLFVTTHFDEAEPFATAAFAILNYLGTFDSAIAGKQLLQFRAIDTIAQIPDVQLLPQDQSP
jgi:hypothetical protein